MSSRECQTDLKRVRGKNAGVQCRVLKSITRFFTYDDGTTETIHETIFDDKEYATVETQTEEEEEEYVPLPSAELDLMLKQLYTPTPIATVAPYKNRKRAALEDFSRVTSAESSDEE